MLRRHYSTQVAPPTPAWLVPVLLVGAVLLPPIPAWAAEAQDSYPAILLHVGLAAPDDSCGRELPACAAYVTAATADPSGGSSYHVYVIARTGLPDTTGTLAGLQLGIEYGAPIGSPGLKVSSWESCTTLQFPTPSPAWPGSGSGNLLTWDRDSQCVSDGIAVAGYFYVTPYGPSWMRVIPRPVDHLAKVANCVDDKEFIVPSAMLGSVYFGGTDSIAAERGFNPCRDAVDPNELPAIVPEVWITSPLEGQSFGDDDIPVEWGAHDFAAPEKPVVLSYRIDSGPWKPGGRGTGRTVLDDLPVGPRRLEVRAVGVTGIVGTAGVNFEILRSLGEPLEFWINAAPEESELVSGAPLRFAWDLVGRSGRQDDVQCAVYVWAGASHEWMHRSPYLVTRESSVELSDLPANMYWLRLEVVDPNRKPTSRLVRFRTDGGARTAPRSIDSGLRWTVAPSADSAFSSPDATLEWSGADLVQWRVDDGEWSDPTPDTQHRFIFPDAGVHRVDLREFSAEGGVPSLPWANGFWSWPPLSATIHVEPPVGPEASIVASPNPSTGPVDLAFAIPDVCAARLTIFDVQGRSVREWLLPNCPAGKGRIVWDGRDQSGTIAPSGVYFVRVEAGNHSVARSIHLIR